jgi:hypothetical protein
VVAEILAHEPRLLSVEILRRVKLRGYEGREDRALRLDQCHPTEDRASARPLRRPRRANSRNTISATWTWPFSMARSNACTSSRAD